MDKEQIKLIGFILGCSIIIILELKSLSNDKGETKNG